MGVEKRLGPQKRTKVSQRLKDPTIEQFSWVCVDERSFRNELEEGNVNSDAIEAAMRVLRFVEVAINETSLQALTSESNDNYYSRRGEEFNLIPSSATSGMCCKIVVGLASGSGISSRGFTGVMRQLRQHLIDCSSKTELVIILTDTWDPVRFRESQADLEAHLRKGVKIVAGLISGNQIRAMPLPF
jgi:hypothetical protein